jgi:hypothetical protein
MPFSAVLDTLIRNLVLLDAIAPEELDAVETLVEAALARHQEEDRQKRRALLRRVK